MARDTDPFVACCPDCAERMATDDPNDVVRFFRRHHAVTGHDVEWERTPPLPEALPSEADLDAAVDAVAEPDASLGTVTVATSEWGWTVGETLDAIHDRRLTGGLWEPRDDHVAVV